MKYIGGDFALYDLQGYLNPESSFSNFFLSEDSLDHPIYFETASDSIAAMIDEISKGQPAELFFPNNYCRQTIEVILGKAVNKDIVVVFYKEMKSLLDLENIHGSIRLLLVMHFNAVFNSEFIDHFKELSEKFTVIEDFVQYPLNISDRKAKYAVNSLRKILPVEVAVTYGLTLKYQYSQLPSSYYQLKKEAARIKSEFILNSSEPDKEILYLSLFKEAESNLFSSETFLAQNGEIEMLNKVNFEKLLTRRRENYKYLFDLLVGIDSIRIIPGDYFCMMILTERQQMIKRKLADTGIFTSIHWLDSKTEFSKMELSIPIDHRYNFEDMDRIAIQLKQALGV